MRNRLDMIFLVRGFYFTPNLAERLPIIGDCILLAAEIIHKSPVITDFESLYLSESSTLLQKS